METLRKREIDFQLFEVLDTQSLTQRPRYAEHSRDTLDAALETAAKIARDLFAPHNASGDRNEPIYDGHRVTMIPEVKTAWDAFAQAGFLAGRDRFEDGGMQLPEAVMTACLGFFTAANAATTGYPFLTIAAANLIKTFASPALQSRYLPALRDGRFSGTMALTEPQAGSSLADLQTSATPTSEGHYRIKGSKLYISGGEHELTENIVHLVLARIQGAPPGVKGISLFVVPKRRIDANGKPQERNDIALAGLIHKLGYRGTTSTALTFGENDDCHGDLVGEPHQGLRYMFQMMNEARIGVGMGAAMIGFRGYLYSLHYARERLQGRPADRPDPMGPPVAIIGHADVRRMLLAQKSYVEGALSLCLYGATLMDERHTAATAEQRADAALLLDLLTPVIKAWPSEYGTLANDLAIQVLGGAGYTREYPVEQCWRDNRLNPIHEGTNGIQALDLLGRKLWLEKGRGLVLLRQAIGETVRAASHESTRPLARDLGQAMDLMQEVITALAGSLHVNGPGLTLANAAFFLHLTGHVVVAWMWLRQAQAAATALSAGTTEPSYYLGKLHAARYFFRYELPLIYRDADLLVKLDDTTLTMQDDWF